MTIQDKADEVLTDHVTKEFSKAIVEANRKVCGEGCLCPTCLKSAMSAVNLWTEWMMVKGNPEPYMYTLENGTLYPPMVGPGRAMLKE